MNKDCLRKNMLLKKEKGETVAKGNDVNVKKNNILENEMADTDATGNGVFGDTMEVNSDSVQLFRVLAVEDEKVLVINCTKKTMPVWMEAGQLDDFEEVKDKGDGLPLQDNIQQQDLDILECYSPAMRKTVYQRYNIISAILPFVDDETMRNKLIAKMAQENGISRQSVRKYLCEYLSSQDIRSLAPQERNTERPLTQDEKNMRKALNVLRTMQEVVEQMGVEQDSLSPEEQSFGRQMYVLSDEKRSYGAVYMLYKNVLKDFADKVDSDLYILPSSVGELILIPMRKFRNPAGLRGIVRTMNQEHVEPTAILSDNVYKYTRATGKITIQGE